MNTGDHLKALVTNWLGVTSWAGCSCERLRKAMNGHKASWSRKPKNMARIVRIMRKTARKAPGWKLRLAARLPGVESTIKGMVIVAIGRAEEDEKKGQA